MNVHTNKEVSQSQVTLYNMCCKLPDLTALHIHTNRNVSLSPHPWSVTDRSTDFNGRYRFGSTSEFCTRAASTEKHRLSTNVFFPLEETHHPNHLVLSKGFSSHTGPKLSDTC